MNLRKIIHATVDREKNFNSKLKVTWLDKNKRDE